jgi:hypothetical protein
MRLKRVARGREPRFAHSRVRLPLDKRPKTAATLADYGILPGRARARPPRSAPPLEVGEVRGLRPQTRRRQAGDHEISVGTPVRDAELSREQALRRAAVLLDSAQKSERDLCLALL